MLGDNPEKSKNPLKKAMRRRNAKTVQFTSPTYYEPSDVGYSTDEEGDEGEFPETAAGAHNEAQEIREEQDQADIVEPLKTGGHQQNQSSSNDIQEDTRSVESDSETVIASDKARSSEEIFDRQGMTELDR